MTTNDFGQLTGRLIDSHASDSASISRTTISFLNKSDNAVKRMLPQRRDRRSRTRIDSWIGLPAKPNSSRSRRSMNLR